MNGAEAVVGSRPTGGVAREERGRDGEQGKTEASMDYVFSSDDEETLGMYYFGPPHEEEEEENEDPDAARDRKGVRQRYSDDMLSRIRMRMGSLEIPSLMKDKAGRDTLRRNVKDQHALTLRYLENLKTWDHLSDTILEKVINLVHSQRTKICNAALEVLCRYAAASAAQSPSPQQSPLSARVAQSRPEPPSQHQNIYVALQTALEKGALLREEAPLGRLVDLSTHASEKVRYKGLWLINFLLRKCPNEASYIALMDHLNNLFLPHALQVNS